MDGMTELEALKCAFIYMAECLEIKEIYDISQDKFMRGEEAMALLAVFARKRATSDNLAWIACAEAMKNASHTAV